MNNIENLTEREQTKLLKLAELADKGNLAIVEYLFELEEKIEAEIPSIKDIIARMKGDQGDSYELTDNDKNEIAQLQDALVNREDIRDEVLESINLKEIAKLVDFVVPQPKEVDTTLMKQEVVREVLSKLPKVENGVDGNDADQRKFLTSYQKK